MMKELSLPEIKQRLLVLMIKFDKICRREGLTYSLMYGTLIGAGRHAGFIPWDEDVDIVMPQRDYQRFLSLSEFRQQKNDDEVLLYDYSTREQIGVSFPFTYAKLVDNLTEIKAEKFREVGGLWIDIFPLISVPQELNERKREFKILRRNHERLSAAHRFRSLTNASPVVMLKQIRCNFYFAICNRIVKHMINIQNRFADYTSDKIAMLGTEVGEQNVFSSDLFDDLTDIEFEKYNFSAFRSYDKILTHIYGNWKKMPPEDKRVGNHEYKAFLKG